MQAHSIEYDNATILVTGAAGFIGANLAVRLLSTAARCHVVGLDDLNDYYDRTLKQARLEWIETTSSSTSSTWSFVKASITDRDALEAVFSEFEPSIVVHLAAQAGVRYSIDHPDAYIESNIVGFYAVLEACRHHPVDHLVYASSSSVYGNSAKVPFSTDDMTDNPVSLYAATKKSGELMAYAYSSLYGIPMTGLRFFTVYGPYGRPDMFIYSAVEKLLAGDSVQLFNGGECLRDFTYIDDVVEGLLRVMRKAPISGPAAPHALYNIGGGNPVRVKDVARAIAEALVRKGLLPADFDMDAHVECTGMQQGDVLQTYADSRAFERDFGFVPQTNIAEGLDRFVAWYAGFHKEADLDG